MLLDMYTEYAFHLGCFMTHIVLRVYNQVCALYTNQADNADISTGILIFNNHVNSIGGILYFSE